MSYGPDTDFQYKCSDLDLGDITLDQGHDTPLGQGQHVCEILFRSKLAVRSYGPETDFGYVCTVTLTLEIWHWVKVMSHHWAIDNNCVKLGSRAWHTLGSWTIIVWNYIQIGQGSTKLGSGHDVNRRTDRQTDRQTGSFLYTPKLCLRGIIIFM